MGTCCGSRRKQEQHPLTDSNAITYQSVGSGQNPTLVIDQKNIKHDDQHGIQVMSDDMPYDAELCDELELNLSLRNIPKQRIISCPCDPFIIISIKDEVKNVYNVVAETEIVNDNPNPDFSKDIRIHYMFEEVQCVRLDVYDANDESDDDHEIKTEDISKHVFVGAAEFIVGDLVCADGQKLVMALEDKNGNKLKKKNGLQPIVIVRSQEVKNNFDEIELKFSSKGLPKMKFCGRINPFFQIYRKTNDDEWASVYKSNHIKSTYSPNWKSFKIQTQRLCNGDVEKPILIKIWDWNREALPVFACEVTTTLAQLLESNSIMYETQNCGELVIKKAKMLKKYPFVSYLKGGLEMHLMAAIDFTGSNGDPNDEDSLHYMGPPDYESQYLKVIKSVGRVLAPYDVDGDIHAYGFGANLNKFGPKKVSHCFNLTYPSEEEAVDGVDGLIEAYKNCLNKIQLYGPTYIKEIIHTASIKSKDICTQNDQSYNVLLIITDGVINDMQPTINAIVNASDLPLSIVIVGVGDANFDNMASLDADDDPLVHSKTGQIMHRCIVQFVPFNEFKNQHITAIAKETLQEIPEQVSSFMSMHNIHPNPPRIDQNENDDYNIASAPILNENK